jgi:hypothetical protein
MKDLLKALLRPLILKICYPGCVTLFPYRLRVVSGPFMRMRYLTRGFASAFAAKVLGTYEKELHGVIAAIMLVPFKRIIDVGAAEGYYAVGFALAHPASPPIIAFEQQDMGRLMLSRMVKLKTRWRQLRYVADVKWKTWSMP